MEPTAAANVLHRYYSRAEETTSCSASHVESKRGAELPTHRFYSSSRASKRKLQALRVNLLKKNRVRREPFYQLP